MPVRRGEREREREREETVAGLAGVEEDNGASVFMGMKKIYVMGEVRRLLPVSPFFFLNNKGVNTLLPLINWTKSPKCP